MPDPRTDIRPESWDADIASLNGDTLQSWQWGEFKQRHGWFVERVAATSHSDLAMAQILFRKRGPITVAYIPRGPVFGPGPGAIPTLMDQIDHVCARHRAIVMYIDPDHPLPASVVRNSPGIVPGPASIQTPRTVKVPLASDDIMLAQMRKDTRYNVTHALRHHVTASVEDPSPANRRAFYRLLRDTAARSGFGIHNEAYYRDILELFGDQAVLIFTRRDTLITSGIIAVRTGRIARSMYSASSSAHRGRGDAALLRFAAMQWARDAGCTHYDLGGIAPAAGQGTERSVSLQGVDRFKTGFGGDIISYPPSLERRYRPALAWLLRLTNPRLRSSSEEAVGNQSVLA